MKRHLGASLIIVLGACGPTEPNGTRNADVGTAGDMARADASRDPADDGPTISDTGADIDMARAPDASATDTGEVVIEPILELDSPELVRLSEAGTTGTVAIRRTTPGDALAVAIVHPELERSEVTLAGDELGWRSIEVRARDDETAEVTEQHEVLVFAEGFAPLPFQVEIADNDEPEVITEQLSWGFWVGDFADLQFVLGSAPERDVVVQFTYPEFMAPWMDPGFTLPMELKFTPQNWDVPQIARHTVKHSFPFNDETARTVDWQLSTTDPAYGQLQGGTFGHLGNYIDDDFFASSVYGGYTERRFVFEGGPTTALHLESRCESPLRYEFATSPLVSVSPRTAPCGADVRFDLSIADDALDGHQWVAVQPHSAYLSVNTSSFLSSRLPAMTLIAVDNDVRELVATLPAMELNESLAPQSCTELVLSQEPASTVSFDITSSAPLQATPLQTALSWGPADWFEPQTLCVRASDDIYADGTQVAMIMLRANTTDLDWSSAALDIPVRVTDDELHGVTAFTREPAVYVPRSGRTEYPLWLFTNTAAVDVKPHFQSSHPDVSFWVGWSTDLGEWAQPSPRFELPPGTMTPVHVVGSTPSYYNAPFAFDLTIVTLEELVNTPGYIVATPGGEAFEITLAAAPTAAVTIPLQSGVPTKMSVTPASITFDASNWDTPQQVTVQTLGGFDSIQGTSLLMGPLQSADPRFDGHDPLSPFVTLRYF